ncbi:hypothetical protein KSP39_PZI001128 [Platanthera zijinensis]|uniref:Uncharacterized protein n=1 Tax=Platanthera zijinensis TaxID=2320716 RepID=A0AAP0C503_9ASPA
MTSLIFWNCRGASKLAARVHLKDQVRENTPVAVVLLETRRQTFSRRDVDRLIGRNWNFRYVPSIGKSGGIILLCLDSIIKVNNVVKDKLVAEGKCNWIEHGDRNSIFFHADSTQWKQENRIVSLNFGDITISEQTEIEEAMEGHFSKRWCMEDSISCADLPMPHERITDFKAQLLAIPPTDAEIRKTIFSFGRNKVQGYGIGLVMECITGPRFVDLGCGTSKGLDLSGFRQHVDCAM